MTQMTQMSETSHLTFTPAGVVRLGEVAGVTVCEGA